MKKAFTIEQTYLQCINCAHRADLLEERKFSCPACGSLYDVVHVLPPAEEKSFSAYCDYFDARDFLRRRMYDDPCVRSGVWRFKEWIMPHLPNEYITTLGEGNVPIIHAGQHLQEWVGDVDLWIILEGMTPTGSFKDFGGTVMISVAKAAGIKAIGCASTGDTSAMAAAYASAAGMQCVVVLPKGLVTAAQIAQPLVHGATVIMLPGTLDDCMRVVRELVQDALLFPANSLNPTRIEGHQASVFLTAQFFDWELPDYFALPVGNGSNGSSVGKGIRLMKDVGYTGRTSRILGCQSQAAHPLARSWSEVRAQFPMIKESVWRMLYKEQKEIGLTTATAALIGNPVSYQKVIREITRSDGAMNIVPEHLLNEAVAVCGKDGHFVCPQTGTALGGIKLAVQNGLIKKGSRIVAISTANGLKFTESAAKDLQGTIIEAPDCNTTTVAKIMGV